MDFGTREKYIWICDKHMSQRRLFYRIVEESLFCINNKKYVLAIKKITLMWCKRYEL